MAGLINERVKPVGDSPRGTYDARVVQNVRICTDHYRLTLGLGRFPASTPGQFVQIECRGAEGGGSGGGGGNSEFRIQNSELATEYRAIEWGPGLSRPALHDPDFLKATAYLRRPFSIAARRENGGAVEIDIIHRVVGRGTHWMETLERGQEVSVIGPLGKGFRIPEQLELALLVGGGVGIPPMIYLAEAVHRAGKRAVAFVGAQRKDLVPLTISPCSPAASGEGEPVLNATEFADYGFPTVVSTDDGSMGTKGFVTGALRKFIEKLKSNSEFRIQNSELAGVVVYCCGPTPMMKATAKVCAELGVVCQVSLEQPMACGMGTCQSCVVKWRGLDAERLAEGEWKYKLTCTDGPVFDSRELAW